jgi:hypothetical protein
MPPTVNQAACQTRGAVEDPENKKVFNSAGDGVQMSPRNCIFFDRCG